MHKYNLYLNKTMLLLSGIIEFWRKVWGCLDCALELTGDHSNLFISYLERRMSRYFALIVSNHIIKGVAEFISNLLDLQLLTVNLIFNIIDPLVKLGDVHFSVLEPSLGSFELVLNAQDFVFQLLFPLNGLLGGHLELLHVLTDHLQFLLDSLEFVLSEFCSLDGSLQFLFLYAEFPGEFVQLLLIVAGHHCGLSEIFVQFFEGDFIVHALALNNLDLLENIVSLF